MDFLLILLGIILIVSGVVGCFVPGLPGPPLSFGGLICLGIVIGSYTWEFYLLWGSVSIIVLVLDYFIPVWFAKKFGATRTGIFGGILGMLVGLFFTPIGMILGLILGSILGDMIAGKDFDKAIKSGLGGAIGTLMTVGVKLIASGWMFWIFVTDAFSFYS